MHRLLTVVALATLTLAGCGGGSSGAAGGDAATPSPTAAASVSATPGPTAGSGDAPETGKPEATKAGSANPPAAHVVIRDGSDDEYLSFLTPSGNLHCAIYPGDTDFRKGQVRCDVLAATWKLPPEPKSCDFDWIRAMTLEKKAAAGACVSDAVDTQGAETVEYGHGLKWHNITCVSEPTGLTCTNTDNKAGFTVSKAAYSLT